MKLDIQAVDAKFNVQTDLREDQNYQTTTQQVGTVLRYRYRVHTITGIQSTKPLSEPFLKPRSPMHFLSELLTLSSRLCASQVSPTVRAVVDLPGHDLASPKGFYHQIRSTQQYMMELRCKLLAEVPSGTSSNSFRRQVEFLAALDTSCGNPEACNQDPADSC